MANSDIMIRFGADIAPLQNAASRLSKELKFIKKGAINAGKDIAKIGAAATAAAGGLVAMVNIAGQNARELQSLSMVAGVSVERFQKLAFAAKTVGVEQDKLADIFKDTSDKVGDFLAGEAGGMTDFFEKIAPKVGVTAEQFRELSGADALQLYVRSLQAANVSQAEMTFYMEAIASDATQLLPILGNNGEALKALGEDFDALGATMSEVDLQQLSNAKTTIDKVGEAVKANANQLAVNFAPIIDELGERFLTLKDGQSELQTAMLDAFTIGARSAGLLANVLRGIHVVAKGLEVAFWGFSTVVNTVAMSAASGLDMLYNVGVDSVNGLIAAFNQIPGVDDIELLSKSNLGGTMFEGVKTSMANLDVAVAEFHDLMMQPLPADAVDEFLEAVKVKSQEAAKVAIEARDTALGGSKAKDPAEDPEVLDHEARLNKMSQLSDAYMKRTEGREHTFRSKLQSIRDAFGDKEIGAISSLFGNLSTLMQSENKKQFEIGKFAAQSQTVVDTITGAQAAYKALAGIPIIGPGLGIAAAGAATAAGMMRLQQIKSTQFGASSVPGGADGGAGGAAASGGASAPAASNSTLTVSGIDPGSLFTGESVSALAQRLLEYQADGGQVVFA